MPTSHEDRSHESIINDTLARLLRERAGLSTAAETLHDGKRPDIIVRLPEGPIILETEFEPARTVEADALSRLGMSIDGQRSPERLRRHRSKPAPLGQPTAPLPTLGHRDAGLAGVADRRHIRPQAHRLRTVSSATPSPGRPRRPAISTKRSMPSTKASGWAGSRLYSSPGTVARVSRVFGAEPGDEVANMAALVMINAMVFQERLASGEAAYQSTSAARVNGIFSRLKLLQMWDHILGIDYYPIFSMARDVVQELSEVEAAEVLAECAKTAATLLAMGAVGRHDLAGRIFNRLISERKLLAAFYTSIPASTLLAGLALSPDRWPQVEWDSAEGISELRVVDPACGTGTLLMAAYRQILQNHSAAAPAGSDNPLLHQVLVEQVINGADVVQVRNPPDRRDPRGDVPHDEIRANAVAHP